MTGKLVSDMDWEYYELTAKTETCPANLRCANGKCLKADQFCDGKNDCGDADATDESDCSNKPNLRLRLAALNPGVTADRNQPSTEGRIEISAFEHGFGGVCDDGFGLEEAHVVCRGLGFPLGAREALTNLKGSGRPILLDDLNCKGDEESLLDCQFSPWTKHDCSDSEWAGVRCKHEQETCHPDEVITGFK